MNVEVTDATQWRRGFWSVWATQFQESFSDNAYRWIVISYVASMAMEGGQRDTLTALAGVLFAAPFVLFSPLGGFLADRHSKRTVILGTKLGEILVMALATAGLA